MIIKKKDRRKSSHWYYIPGQVEHQNQHVGW